MNTTRWPYALALTSALVGFLGFAYAPFSGIAYLLGLPGIGVAAWWALAHTAPHRAELAIAALLLVGGLAAGLVGLFVPALGLMKPGREGFFAALLVLPLPVLVLAIAGASAGLTCIGGRHRRSAHIVRAE